MTLEGLIGFPTAQRGGPRGVPRHLHGLPTGVRFEPVQTYTDTFAGADGRPITMFSDRSFQWKNVSSGSGWTYSDGAASNAGTTAVGQIMWIETQRADVDITLNGVPTSSGEGIAFRIQDANNYWIFHTVVTSQLFSQTCTFTGTTGWSAWSADTQGCGTTYGGTSPASTTISSGPCAGQTDFVYDYEYVSGICATGYRRREYQNQYSITNNYADFVDWRLSKVTNGSASTVATTSGNWASSLPTTVLRVVASGSSISCSANGTVVVTTTDSYLSTEKRHGIGQGPAASSATNSKKATSFVIRA